jgi:hypothetical protein
MTVLHRLSLAVLLAGLAATLAGCTGGGEPTDESTPTPSATSSPSATATPTPTPTSGAAAPCESLLTDEENTRLEQEGRTLRDASTLVPYYPPMQQFLDAGGTACLWSNGASDVFVLVAQLPVDQATATGYTDQLLGLGWTQTDSPLPGTLQAPEGMSLDTLPAAVYSDGVFYAANYAGILEEIAALQ